MLNTTILNAAHHAQQNARMVDFGGWEMPVHYGSQISEHHAVRRDCGMFDVSHMCAVDLVGIDASRFLRRLLANNVERLKTSGKALYSAMLNESGGIIDDLIVYRRPALVEGQGTPYRLVINAGTAEKDLAWMTARLQDWGLAATLTPLRSGDKAVGMIAVQGPNAKTKVWAALPEIRAATESLPPFFGVAIGELFVATTGYTGEDGFEITLPAAQTEALWNKFLAVGIPPCGLGARDTLRLEAGMNLYGQDMDETVSPLDAGLAWCTELASERDFVGKSALLAHGQRAQFLGLKLLDKGVLRAHQKVFAPQGEGEITSGTFSPTLGFSIALARLPLGVSVGDPLSVEIRGKLLPVQVVKPPFVRHGKALV
ncbi:MAG: glycine cleavage system aminomethyltransferase GcvT [Zoogloeaceae bacterium]|jgi:aminomethyltransferase|nr:glycine cleavage system aminomethyltransferase GcvT [Zoogloeaceae bacterium]